MQMEDRTDACGDVGRRNVLKRVVVVGRAALRGVSRLASLEHRKRTQLAIQRAGHNWGCPERPWPIFLLLTPFFCCVKVSGQM